MTKFTTRSKNTVEQSTTIAPALELALPAEFDIKPDFVVPVSKFLEAHIFANKPHPNSRYERTKGEEILGYRTCIIDTRTGLQPDRRLRCTHDFSVDPLDVQIFLKMIAAEAAPKQRRTVERDEEF
jgi:hypothetical protein